MLLTVDDSLVLWIREEQTRTVPSWEVVTNRTLQSLLESRSEFASGTAALAVDLSAAVDSLAAVDIPEPIHAVVHGKPVRAVVQHPNAHQDCEFCFRNMSLAGRTRLRSSLAPCRKTDLSTDRALCFHTWSAVAQHQDW